MRTLLLTFLLLVRAGCSADTPDAAALAQQIVTAHGGPEKLLRTFRFAETYFLNGKTAPGAGTDRASLVQPPYFWFVGDVERVGAEKKRSVTEDVWMWTLGPLVHPRTKLERLPDAVLDGKPANTLRISVTIEPPIEASFDAVTHDLVKIVWNGQQFLFSQPVEVSGTRVPSRCVLLREGGNEGIRTELRDIQRLAGLPAEKGRVEDEPLLFTGETRAAASAQLLRVPSAPPRISSANGTMEFEAGRDFAWQAGSRTVTLTADSRIPFKTSAELHPPANAPNSYKQQRGTEQWMFFGPHGLMHSLQCVANYASADEWKMPQPAAAPEEQLGKLRAKLRAKQPVKLVMLGDSISTEADASALAKVWPFQTGYPSLVAERMESQTGAKVTLANLAVGGMDSAWGVTRVADVIKEKPDVLLLAFGMNDASGRRKPEEFASLTKQMADPVRAALPDCTVILVTSMTANSEWVHAAPELYPLYAAALAKLTGPGVACADVTAAWSAVEARKKHMDITGNGLNHPNDFGHRLYADTIMAVLGLGK